MRVLYLLLLTLGLLTSQLAAGFNMLTGLGQRSDHYMCVKKGGTCNFSPCPLFNRIEGTCYNGKAKCCIR
ncbi:beta-defensin 1 [Hippopotamus amphibius kiboko]|uniref:beta-defensin 1 n=1 Tax=Hippopotamus amphibius kiboko TaxID=575201 RepID=UPI002591A81E|nr:beta-defensin 1 [Hippopotamus amphibius kiboko]XP_057552943.1 beta-defensin 1 [Hippopotamus amphibius kiboko]XP_057552944.1 beta-defensin 1 [Hippopotamus amphibius kiboko]XP_057552945.1 beta-defensin 1 [Hippopotamus amphibius kiboko]